MTVRLARSLIALAFISGCAGSTDPKADPKPVADDKVVEAPAPAPEAAPAPADAGAKVCCESFGFGSMMKKCCESYAWTAADACVVEDGHVGGGKAVVADDLCKDVAK
jgi:hypothetical protein